MRIKLAIITAVLLAATNSAHSNEADWRRQQERRAQEHRNEQRHQQQLQLLCIPVHQQHKLLFQQFLFATFHHLLQHLELQYDQMVQHFQTNIILFMEQQFQHQMQTYMYLVAKIHS